ncbi:MAG: Holliday junction branch migration protein RuvA [Candidatus Margulisbacteria bacterium]|nr:Holliday junction branch migration protein RuvA [Candidatus Margulisiibacteriota bacterium]
MIFSVSGRLKGVFEGYVVVEAAGVGYEIFIPSSIIETLPALEKEVLIYTFHYIREDQQLLFGFLSPEDKRFFILLTSISGIGPKVGLKVLSTLSSDDVIRAILQENISLLTSVPGIGKKVAERLIIELKDKVPKLSVSDISLSSLGNSTKIIISDDLILALKTLGYHPDEIKRAISAASHQLSNQLDVGASIKIVLRYLS